MKLKNLIWQVKQYAVLREMSGSLPPEEAKEIRAKYRYYKSNLDRAMKKSVGSTFQLIGDIEIVMRKS